MRVRVRVRRVRLNSPWMLKRLVIITISKPCAMFAVKSIIKLFTEN